MYEYSDIDFYAMSDKALVKMLGHFLREIRLQQNKTQLQIAEEAGIVRSTVVQIENGHGGTIITFIQIMRSLGQLHLLQHFQVKQQISPLLLAKQEQYKRLKASKKKNNNQNKKTDW